jgi:hypothetical protein
MAAIESCSPYYQEIHTFLVHSVYRFSMAVPVDVSEGYKGSRGKYDLLPELKETDIERGLPEISVTSHPTPRTAEYKTRELSKCLLNV